MHKLKINGFFHNVDAEDDMPLLWVLRDILGKTGTKFGCGIGQCGACTVIVNGKSVRSCLMLVSDIKDGEILTIEGLENKHPVQLAWIDEQVPQCGYCQSGQIMATVALLSQNLNPSDEEIDQKITNLCRCGTYVRVRRAIRRSVNLMKNIKG